MQLAHLVVACLVPLALWILISGLDDLFITLAFLVTRRKPFSWPADGDLDRAPERRIAILVPLWREHRVIGQMLEHNLAAIRYSAYDVFVGVYPNDEATARVVEEAARLHPRVHLVIGPHDGPTSKGDCLNWIYRRMGQYEALHGVHYDIVMTHDAEDLVDPESLRLVSWFSRDYAMVQVPVLPLPTPIARVDPRTILRRVRRIPDQGHPHAPAAGRLSARQRRGHRFCAFRPGASGRPRAAA